MAQQQPWDQQNGESAKAYRAFLKYRDLDADRSVAKAYAAYRQNPRIKAADGTWQNWSAKYNWPARAQAWDQHHAKVREAAREEATRAEERKWARRRIELLELEYGSAALLLKVAAEKLERQKTLTNVSTAIEIASKLMRRACKLPVEVEENPPDNFRDLFFESSGEIAASTPATAVPEMPADVMRKPRINTAKAEPGRDGAPQQPPKPAKL